MFIPIGDDNRDRQITPYINYLFILINILVFVFIQDYARNESFIYSYSAVPAEILSGHDIYGQEVFTNPINGNTEAIYLGRTDIPVYLTLLTSMFMHGGWAHLLGNMLYLWICGDNLENVMGHRNYFFFYLICGILAGLSHVFSVYFFGQNMLVPSLGASGAISGVLGGYMLLFPKRRVHVWLFFFFTISVPAFIAVGLWFIFQVVNSLGALGGEEAGSIAYAAHIGGFIAGLILAKLFVRRQMVLSEEERKSFR